MASVNKVIIVGNVVKDPELKELSNGAKKVEFTVAVNESYKDKDGNVKKNTEYVSMSAWAKTAEFIAQYVKKGGLIYVEGKMKTSSWEKDGEKKYKTEVVVDQFQNLSKSESSDSNSPSNDQPEDDLPF